MPRVKRVRPIKGTVFQRASDGLWVGRVSLKVGGITIRETVYGKTEPAAVEALNKLVSAGPEGSSRMTVAQLFEKWTEDLERTERVRSSTLERYKQSAAHVIDTIGAAKVAKLTPESVRDLDRLLVKRKKTSSQRERAYGVLSAALSWAVRQEIATRNVCTVVAAPKVTKTRNVRSLTEAETRRLIEKSRCERLGALYVLAIGTGLRQGELFGLTWQHLDLERGVVRVEQALLEDAHGVQMGPLKTASSRRVVAIAPVALERMLEYRAAAGKVKPEDLVFTAEKGGYLRKSVFIRKVWNVFREKAELPDDVSFHVLRHTFATMMLKAGVHPKVVQQMMGHSSIAMTMDVYSDADPSMQIDAAKKLSDLLLAPVAV
jgi:integrase